MEFNNESGKIFWLKGILNGLLAWLLGFIIYLIPGFIKGVQMGMELGPNSKNPEKVGAQIGEAISLMYRDNFVLTAAFIVITFLFIFWRAKTVSKNTGNRKITNGLLVSLLPVLFSLLTIISIGFHISTIAEIIFFAFAGYMGGKTSKQETAVTNVQPV